MKNKSSTVVLCCCLFLLGQLHARADDLSRFKDAVERAAKHALLEMRPTARFQSASVVVDTDGAPRIREATSDEGGKIKARVEVSWITAFTGNNKTTVIDVYLTEEAGAIYLTRYKLYSDNHNIPITLPTDARVRVKVVEGGAAKSSDF